MYQKKRQKTKKNIFDSQYFKKKKSDYRSVKNIVHSEKQDYNTNPIEFKYLGLVIDNDDFVF